MCIKQQLAEVTFVSCSVINSIRYNRKLIFRIISTLQFKKKVLIPKLILGHKKNR